MGDITCLISYGMTLKGQCIKNETVLCMLQKKLCLLFWKNFNQILFSMDFTNFLLVLWESFYHFHLLFLFPLNLLGHVILLWQLCVQFLSCFSNFMKEVDMTWLIWAFKSWCNFVHLLLKMDTSALVLNMASIFFGLLKLIICDGAGSTYFLICSTVFVECFNLEK